VDPILKTGIHGIAVSSAISESANISEASSEFIGKIKNLTGYAKQRI
jgi:thiamine monophosphate synthase